MPLLPELDTRSVLDTVEENFQKIDLKAYAERMIYTGEHALSKEELIKHFEKTIHDVNSSYCEINVRGLLLVYNSYFVHIIEGSEDTIHRHLRFLFACEAKLIEKYQRDSNSDAEDTEGLQVILEKETPYDKDWKMFKRLKLLTVYHSIKTLLFKEWHAVTAHPPSLVGKLNVYGPLAEHIEQLRICLDKIRKLCDLVRSNEEITFDGLRTLDPKMETLPEVNLLDFLLQSPHLLDLRHVVHLHRRVDDYPFYFEYVWPLPTQYTPKFLYKLKVDDSFVEPLPVMPWEIKTEVGEEEEREDQSDTSSD